MTERLSFSKQLPTLQIAWDSTSLSLLKTCPYKYMLTMVEGWSPKAERVDLVFGIFYHAALEEYDHEICRTGDHDKATIAATRKALTLTWINGEPWESDHPLKTRESLIRAVVWYTETFKDNPIKTLQLADGRAAVELSFKFETELIAADGQNYLLCGHLDKVGMLGDDPWVLDKKTSKHPLNARYFEQYTPNNQMSLYTAASKIVLDIPAKGVIIDAAQIGKSYVRFARGFAQRTPAQSQEFYNDTLVWIAQAEHYAVTNNWPMNDTACHHYGGCVFQGVCKQAPAVRRNFLMADFTQDDPWDPLKSR